MPPMNVHADDKAKWIVAGVRLSFQRFAKVTARIVTVNTIEDFAFVEHDWFTQAVLAYVMLKAVEVLSVHRRECLRKRVRFKRHHGFRHDALPSTIIFSAASHSLRSQRLKPPTCTGFG